MVVAAREAQSRWKRGIRKPDETKLAALRALFEREPGLSKTELCVRTKVGRSTLPYYLRHLREAVAQAVSKNEDARRRVALTQVDLVERVASAADEVREEIARLRAARGAKNTSAIFAGYRTLVQIERLVAELIGEIAPPVQNTYVVQVAALLERPVPASSLSATARAALGMENGDAR